MKHRYSIYLMMLSVVLISGCNPVTTSDNASDVSPDAVCAQVKQLIDQHSSGFSQLKGAHLPARRMDIWDAKYHLVGKGCQIWGWSDGKQAYMCSLTVPDEETAIQRFDKAVKFTRQCLGEPWQADYIERIPDQAYRTTFSTQAQQTVASVHRVKSQGLFKTEWTIYYFIGDRDKSF